MLANARTLAADHFGVGGGGSTSSSTSNLSEFIALQGFLKKLKTTKRRYFVLFREGGDLPARLDYFESERKFRNKPAEPKRSIALKACFHIDQRRDTKHRFVIGLYTKDDCFGLVMESQEELRRWLDAMHELHGAQCGDQKCTNFGKSGVRRGCGC